MRYQDNRDTMEHKIKILLTEDQEIHQEIFIEMLVGSGIQIDIASNGQEAIDKSSKKAYSLIVMDIDMPIMNGYEATRNIRQYDKNIPIIALTSNNTVQDILKSKEIGMNEHLTKPTTVPALYRTLSKYIHLQEAI
jgi:CheY-like chemotaxis protein